MGFVGEAPEILQHILFLNFGVSSEHHTDWWGICSHGYDSYDPASHYTIITDEDNRENANEQIGELINLFCSFTNGDYTYTST